MTDPDFVKENDPFEEYFDGFLPKQPKEIAALAGLRYAFGYTGVMDKTALKARQGQRFNTQGIIVTDNKPKVVKYKSRLLNEHEEVMEKLNPLIEKLNTVRKCYFCQHSYNPKDNYGTWNCSYHPRPGISLLQYDCCGRRKSPLDNPNSGCTPCDHQSISQDRTLRWGQSVVDIPLIAALKMRIPVDSYTTTTNEKLALSRAHVRRAKI
jgi:hypothetical protein